MGAFVARATQDDVDVAVIGGDSTDHRLDAHTPAFLALTKRVKEISSQKPLLMLQGTFSHEPQGMLRVFSTLCDAVFVADEICQVALTVSNRWVRSEAYRFTEEECLSKMTSEPWKCVFTCLPVLNKGVLLGRGEVSDADQMGELVAKLLGGFAPINAFFAQQGIPTVGVSHGTVHSSKTEHGVPMHGTDHEFTSGTLFSAGCSSFMLNHIHLHQEWEVNGRRVAYSGSLPCLHHGEIGDKGWLLWSVNARSSEFEFVASPAQRFAEFNFDGSPDVELLRQADVVGKKVRVRYTLNVEDRASVDHAAIQAALVGAEEVKIEPRLLPVLRVRSEEVASAATHAERLSVWLRVSNTDAQVGVSLQDALAKLAVSDPEQIAKAAIAKARAPITVT